MGATRTDDVGALLQQDKTGATARPDLPGWSLPARPGCDLLQEGQGPRFKMAEGTSHSRHCRNNY